MIGPSIPAGDAIEMSSQPSRRDYPAGRITFKWRQLLPSPTSFLLLIFFICSLLMNGGLSPATKRGFFCNDTTIQYPFKPDTVSFKVLLVIALLMPTLVIKFTERRLTKALRRLASSPSDRQRKDSDPAGRSEEGTELMTPTSGESVKRRLVVNDDNDADVEVVGDRVDVYEDDDTTCDNSPTVCEPSEPLSAINLRRVVRQTRDSIRAFSDLQLFYFGFTATSFLTGIGKITCGRFRPHFMERCKPDIDCTLPGNLYRYIRDFECTNKALKPRDFSYISTSWPSGHASIVFFAMLYLVIYLDTVMATLTGLRSMRRGPRGQANPLIVYSIYVLLIGLATFVALTRVADYHHHPLDVLSGCILGTVAAVVMGEFVLKPRFAPIRDHIKGCVSPS